MTAGLFWGRVNRGQAGYRIHIIEGSERRMGDGWRYLLGRALCQPRRTETTYIPATLAQLDRIAEGKDRPCAECRRRWQREGAQRPVLPDAHDPEARRERSIDAAIRALQPAYNSRHEPGTGMLLDAADRIAYLDADLAADLRRLASDYRAAVSGLRQRIEELA